MDDLYLGGGGGWGCSYSCEKSFCFVEYQHYVHKLPLFVAVHKNMIYCIAELMCPLVTCTAIYSKVLESSK